MDELSDLINDDILTTMISNIDTDNDDFGLYDMQVVISYVCDNYQIERSIIRGRRAVLGVYPKDEEGEFASRDLYEIKYTIDENNNYYEFEAYRTLTDWIVSQQNQFESIQIEREVQPVLEAFFSSPWAYKARLVELYGQNQSLPESVWKSADRWIEDENEIIEQMADVLDDVDSYPSRLVKLIYYIETELLNKKVVIFTD